jgi:hypothetical protein
MIWNTVPCVSVLLPGGAVHAPFASPVLTLTNLATVLLAFVNRKSAECSKT